MNQDGNICHEMNEIQDAWLSRHFIKKIGISVLDGSLGTFAPAALWRRDPDKDMDVWTVESRPHQLGRSADVPLITCVAELDVPGAADGAFLLRSRV